MMTDGILGRAADKRRLFAVGDVHGCAARLDTLLARLPLDPERDTLVFLGDYIDRGPDSRGVLDTLCRLRREGVSLVGLLGNHEYLLLEYGRDQDPTLLPYLCANGMEQTLASYGAANQRGLADLSFMPEEHRRFLHSLLPYWETEDFLFVHAGLRPGLPVAEQDLAILCEGRGEFLRNEPGLDRRVVFGHTPFLTPLLTPGKIGIDTGAVYGNLLTAVELPAVRFYHA